MKSMNRRSERIVIKCSPETKQRFLRVVAEMYGLGVRNNEEALLKLIELWESKKRVSVMW